MSSHVLAHVFHIGIVSSPRMSPVSSLWSTGRGCLQQPRSLSQNRTDGDRALTLVASV